MVKYVTREGPAGAVDVEVALTTQCSDTAPGQAFVPFGVSKLRQMFVCIGDASPCTDDGGAAYLLRISGAGLKDGDQVFTLGYAYALFTGAGTSGRGNTAPILFDVDVDINPGGPITLYAQQTGGVTVGTPEIAVTLGFV